MLKVSLRKRHPASTRNAPYRPKTSAKMRIRICRSTNNQRPLRIARTSWPAHHPNEKPWLLRGSADTRVADDTDGEASRKTRKPDRQPSAELDKALEERHPRLHCAQTKPRHETTATTTTSASKRVGRAGRTVCGDEHRDDEAVDLRTRAFSSRMRRDGRVEGLTAMIPAMMTGTTFFIMRSGRRTAIAEMPTPDLAVP